MGVTLGQTVLYRRAGGGEPQAAIVTRVWSEDCINLTVFPENGPPLFYSSVPRYLADAKDAWGWELRDEDKGKIGSSP